MISSNIIKSLTFYTTKGKYGLFGEEQGTPFTSKSKEGVIVGFHGRKGLFLDAIAVHVKEGKLIPPVRPPLPLKDISKPVIKPAIEGDPLWPSKQTIARGAPVEEVFLKLFPTSWCTLEMQTLVLTTELYICSCIFFSLIRR